MSEGDTPPGAWPLEVRQAVEALEERFDIELVSVKHHEGWVERARRLEAALRKCVDILDAKPARIPYPIFANVSHSTAASEALHAARAALGDLRGASLLGDAGAPAAATCEPKNPLPPAPTMAPTGAGSGGWLPIASAPRDGTDFLALCAYQRKHHQMVGCFAPSGKFASWPGRSNYSPTHWMPLPPPPAAGQDLSEAVLDGSTDKKITEPD